MTQGVVFPDAEDVWQRFLKPKLAYKVGTKTRADVQFVKVLRAGGNSRLKVIDSPQMIFECYAEDDAKAAEFARTVRALVFAAEGTEIVPGVVFKKLRDVTGPSFVNDSQHDSSRYSFTVMTELRGTVVADLMTLEGTI